MRRWRSTFRSERAAQKRSTRRASTRQLREATAGSSAFSTSLCLPRARGWVGASFADSRPSSSPRRPRARLTRLFIVPTAQPQNLRRFLVRQTRCADEDQSFALVGGQLQKRDPEILEIHVVVLPGRRGESGRQVTVRVFDFEAVFAMFRVESIAENGEEPSAQIRSRFVSGQVGPGFHQRLLDEIVGPIRLPRQRHGEGSQGRNRREQFRFQRTVRVTQFPSPWPRTVASSSWPSDPDDREFPSPSPSQKTGPSASWR